MSLPKYQADYWEAVYRQPETHPWSGVRPEWWQPVLDKFEPTPKTVLDIGCGEGDKGLWLAEQGYEVTGFDISSQAIATAQRRAEYLAPPPTFLVGDITKLSSLKLPHARYGLVLDVLVSQFLPINQEDEYLAALADRLSPGGLVIYKMLERKSEEAPTIAREGLTREYTEGKLASVFKVSEVLVESAATRKDTEIITFFLRAKEEKS